MLAVCHKFKLQKAVVLKQHVASCYQVALCPKSFVICSFLYKHNDRKEGMGFSAFAVE